MAVLLGLLTSVGSCRFPLFRSHRGAEAPSGEVKAATQTHHR